MVPSLTTLFNGCIRVITDEVCLVSLLMRAVAELQSGRLGAENAARFLRLVVSSSTSCTAFSNIWKLSILTIFSRVI